MRIAIDASRTTVSRRTGTETYALQLLRNLLPLGHEHDFDLYFRDMPPEDLLPLTGNYTQHLIRLRRAWTHVRFAGQLWLHRPAVTWVPAHTLPFAFPGRAVVTVHDLGYLHFPEAHPPNERRYLDLTTRYSAWRARLVLADSWATQNDLVTHYGVAPEKIRVVYPGVDEALNPVTDPAILAAMRQRYGLPTRYLLFLGTLQPRKNIARLVQAFAEWRAQSTHQDVALALGGKPGWLFDPAWVEGVENVHLLGYIDDADLAALYSGALGLVMPSLYEGFGFPVLEALRCGIPVLCSNTSSLPELGGEAAIQVNPLRVDAIAYGIFQLVEDNLVRQELLKHAPGQVARFTWEAAAWEVLDALEQAAEP
ncbi:MAG: glycosyltransferase family 4 protein [Anaerolineae bacterium]|nr:glycosyltransferase family 4 protein [Anaerolineae bacterium]